MQYPPPAESESSYGTNYPGTMYYMGAPRLVNRTSADYESVTLPKKPETVSDSDSEHEDMYATIPAYQNS